MPSPNPYPADRLLCFFFTIAVIGSVFIQPAALCACPFELPETTLIVKDRKLTVEVAIAPKARGCGLSRRNHLPQDNGMLFVYNSPRTLQYWMKDTFIPLSIAFLDAAGRIMSIQQMAPDQTAERYRSPKPAQYVLEVNRGWFDLHHIKVGDTVFFNLADVMEKQ